MLSGRARACTGKLGASGYVCIHEHVQVRGPHTPPVIVPIDATTHLQAKGGENGGDDSIFAL